MSLSGNGCLCQFGSALGNHSENSFALLSMVACLRIWAPGRLGCHLVLLTFTRYLISHSEHVVGSKVSASSALLAHTLQIQILLDWFLVSSLVSLLRTSILTWSWICIVRRHLKEVTEIVQRPKLQTIISIATAHPFAPRPDMSDIPILVSSGANAAASPNSNHSFHFWIKYLMYVAKSQKLLLEPYWRQELTSLGNFGGWAAWGSPVHNYDKLNCREKQHMIYCGYLQMNIKWVHLPFNHENDIARGHRGPSSYQKHEAPDDLLSKSYDYKARESW